MASSPCGSSNFDGGLEIKTRSVEQTLIPLVSQVSHVLPKKTLCELLGTLNIPQTCEKSLL